MKISVIAIFYNSQQYVLKCVDSILSQEGVDLELIAVDDCSCDETYELLCTYKDQRIRVVRHEKNQGISFARNTGLKNVSGDCFYFIDGDDYLPKGALATLAQYFNDAVDWVQGSYNMCTEEGAVTAVKEYKTAIYNSHRMITENFDSCEFIYTHNRLIHTKWKSNFFPIGKAHEDRFWNVNAFQRLNCIVNTDSSTYNYVVHPTSFSNRSRAMRFYLDSAMELQQKMDDQENCWKNLADLFLVTTIEKNIYLWKQDSDYRKDLLRQVRDRSRKVRLNIGSFPRFTQMVHRMIEKGYSDWVINFVASAYRCINTSLKRPV